VGSGRSRDTVKISGFQASRKKQHRASFILKRNKDNCQVLFSVQSAAVTCSELLLEPLTRENLQAVAELDLLCLGGLWTLAGYQRELESPNSELLTLTSSAQTQSGTMLAMGCFWAIVEEAHITVLAVHPDTQNQGMGKALILALLRRAVRRKLERATLEVRASNQIALSLYEKLGFQVAGRRKGYYQKTNEDALILWRGGLQEAEFFRQLQQWERQARAKLRDRGWELSETAC